MYEYELIEKELNTKFMGRVFLQFESIESTGAKCRNISQDCPKGMLVLSEDDIEGNTYLDKDLKNFKNKVLMSLILKLDRNNFNKDFIESLINCLGAASIIEVANENFEEVEYIWEKIILGNEFAAEIDSYKSLKNNDKSIILSFRLYYNKDISREILIGKILNTIELNFDNLIKDNLENIAKTCTTYLKSKDTNIKVNKRNRKTVKELENIRINKEGKLVGKHKSEEIIIDWKDYEIDWS
jgi:hypothetical protein